MNKHANGVFYLGGFVIECLLKAKLLEKYAWLRRSAGNPPRRTSDEQRLWRLCYRSHDLAAILERLPEVRRQLWEIEHADDLYLSLQEICEQWTIFARYSPRTAKMKSADQFLRQIQELKRWLMRS